MGFYYRNYLTDISIREKNERTIYKMGCCIDYCYYYFLDDINSYLDLEPQSPCLSFATFA